MKKTASGSNRALMQRLLEALDHIGLSRILHGDCGLYVGRWWPLHDERGEPLFSKADGRARRHQEPDSLGTDDQARS